MREVARFDRRCDPTPCARAWESRPDSKRTAKISRRSNEKRTRRTKMTSKLCRGRLSAAIRWAVVSLTCASLASSSLGANASSYHPTPADLKVAIWRGEWYDSSRRRTVPVKIYYPAENGGKTIPVILFSQGLGASRETYSYLGEYWAAHGYISVHVPHAGDDFVV